MRNDGPKPQVGVPRSSSARNNGFLPASLRAISGYLKIVSSGASSVACTVRSASASVASSIADRDGDTDRDQVQWAGFDKLEGEGNVCRQVLLLGYKSGFQVWDVEEADDVHELVSRHDGPVSFLQMQKKPFISKRSTDKFAEVRPLLVIAGGSMFSGGNCIQDELGSPCNGSINGFHEQENSNVVPTVVLFFSLKSHSYVNVLKFRTAVHSIRCSARVVAISQAAQIHCLDAATLDKEYTILTHPIPMGPSGSGSIGYGPLAVGNRWLAYSGSPIAVSNTSRVSPQHLARATTFSSSPSNVSLVAQYAKESSKQLATGIVTLGDMGYKKLSSYCSELLPDTNNSLRTGNSSWKTNGTINGHLPDAEAVGMVIVRDIVSKSVITQFRAHESPISALCFDPSGTLLVTASVQGHNINVFRILPSMVGGSSGFDSMGSYIHLYKLQRGLTNAVIQDISFSDDSQWIMISSSRGTSHLFAISPSGVNSHNGNGLVPTKQSVRWPSNSCVTKLNGQNLCLMGCPITLSAVSRIRNGSNGWRGTVTGAAAVVTGRASALSGAIASAFHYCRGRNVYPDSSSARMKNHLLVFSPSGSIIQYVLRLSSGIDSVQEFGSIPAYGSSRDDDVKLIIEAVQKWDVCQRKSRREREDNVDIYGDHGVADNCKSFVKGSRKSTSVHPTNNGNDGYLKQSSEERHHFYISEAELRMHSVQVPLWARSEIYFHVMDDDKVRHEDHKGGEVEVETFSTRVVEARSRDLVPVFDHVQTPKSPHLRECASIVANGSEPLLYQKSGLSDGEKLSRRSSCRSLDGLSAGAVTVYENVWRETQVSTGIFKGNVNNNSLPNLESQLGFVNNTEGPKEAPPELVNSKEHPKMETHFEEDNLQG